MRNLRVPGSLRSALAGYHAVLAAVLLLPAAALIGCSDHRISLQEFLSSHERAAPLPGSAVAAPPSEAAATQPAAAAPTDQYMGPYKTGPGDILAMIITGIEQTGVVAPIQARVDREGNIDLPIAGKIQVAGLELQDVEKAVQAAYVPSVYRQASVHIDLVRPEMANVLVTGAVTTPGLVQLPRSQRNLLYAIAGAGGASQLASGEVVLQRLRNPEESAIYNLRQPEQLQQALAMEPLQNGDVVIVNAAQPNAIFIGGLVMAPHVQLNPPGTQMNVLQAIASAGGLRPDLTPTEMTLIRRQSDGKDVHVKLDVARIQTGKDPNITLAPGDILWVPDTLLTRAEDWANRNLYFRAGANFVATYNVTGLSYMNDTAARASSNNTGGTLQNTVDPLGFLQNQQQINNIQNNLPPPQ
jgi:polysaccharide export outer membrane protein